MPRKPKYSEKLAKYIAALVETGDYTINEICSLSGITRKTYCKWKRERLQFTDVITRAEDKKLEKIVVEAKHSLVKLLQGMTEVETKSQVKNMKNGTQQIIYTVSDKHIPPDFLAIKFVLENKDSKNFSTGIHRLMRSKSKRRIRGSP